MVYELKNNITKSESEHFCEVVVHVSSVPNKQHYNVVLVVVYFVDGSVVAYS